MPSNSYMIPVLNTPSATPAHSLETLFLAQCSNIRDWFNRQWALTTPPIYGSVDLRNAGFKLAPVDMNLFPAGFNNLNPHFLSVSIHAAEKIIHQISPDAKTILLIPESHTRNVYYWENIKVLRDILNQAGFDVRFGSLDASLAAPQTIRLSSGEEMMVEPISRQGNQLHVQNVYPDLILLNNDLSQGIPEILLNIKQTIVPPAELGWHQRLKSGHFQFYAEVADEFAHHIGIDPWLIAPLFEHCGEIDFMQSDGMECLIGHANDLFTHIQKKYDEYHIQHQPFLVVKADAGTYGMAVMTVRNVDELMALNRKQRTRMSMTKGGQPVRQVIVQEGVYTFETIVEQNSVAEPVVYLFGETVVGGFYRIHREKGTDENLNAPGMRFEPLAFSQSCHEPCGEKSANLYQNRYFTYGIIAQLSMLAAAREVKRL